MKKIYSAKTLINIKNAIYRTALPLSMSATLGLGLIGCGKQEFNVSRQQSASEAPGTYEIPAKVDILLAEDNTGSMANVLPKIKAEFPKLLNSLESSGWDYRFATIPLFNQRTITQIVASKFDSNWGSLWKQPYPGAPRTSSLPDYLFSKPANYGGFITSVASGGSLEPGFENIKNTLYGSIRPSFLRDDAMLVILVAGNGEDTSGVKMCRRADNYSEPCEYQGQSGTLESSFQQYKSAFLGLKNQSAQLKFYSVVSPYDRKTCLSQSDYALAGERYIRMANELGGRDYDICTQPISSVVTSLKSELQSQRLSFRTQYIFIPQDADPNSVQVTIYRANGTIETPTRSASNGWQYIGQHSGVYAIDSPVPMNWVTSGYAIKLNGSAKLIGNDYADVDYDVAGVNPSF